MRENNFGGFPPEESGAWANFIRAHQPGWPILEDLHQRIKATNITVVAQESGIDEKYARDLHRIYRRILPLRDRVLELELPLGHLEAISKAIGTVQRQHNDMEKVLKDMVEGCIGKQRHEAEATVNDIARATARRDLPERVNRFNFAKHETSNMMVHCHGVFQSHIARNIEERAQAYIDSVRSQNAAVSYDQALAQWMVARLLGNNRGDLSTHSDDSDEKLNHQAPHPTEYQPVIIMSGDPNIDYQRGHFNLLNGGTIPIEEAINLRLARTGWVCHTSLVDGKPQLNFITPIIQDRFSTLGHRLGVMLETLVCAQCDMPAVRCQAHHIEAWAYSTNKKRDWNGLTNMCRHHNGANDDDPKKPPKNGRVDRDEHGWPAWKPHPDATPRYNPNPKFRQGWRGTTLDMEDNRKSS
ncbi:MAG: HNH endonuclease [Corynebacterium sp.]|nr:HNH endonuclease [Corynebacterium sp.]